MNFSEWAHTFLADVQKQLASTEVHVRLIGVGAISMFCRLFVETTVWRQEMDDTAKWSLAREMGTLRHIQERTGGYKMADALGLAMDAIQLSMENGIGIDVLEFGKDLCMQALQDLPHSDSSD